jgi:hypothetical protein
MTDVTMSPTRDDPSIRPSAGHPEVGSMQRPRSLLLWSAILTALLLVVQVAPVGAATPTRWGSKLTTSVQPQNANRSCDSDDAAPNPDCSWMFRHVYGREGGHKAPKNGYIDKVRVIACSAGSFKLQFGKIRKKPGSTSKYQAKVRTTTSKISFKGDPDGCDDQTYTINTIDIPDVYVKKGESFGVRTKLPKALRCNSGSPNVLEFVPPLPNGGSYRNPTDTNGCDPLIELQYRS